MAEPIKEFTPDAKHVEITRELAMRAIVYPRLIAGGKLKPEQAQRQNEILKAIAQDYLNAIHGNPGPLFNQPEVKS
jgi:hypothetical protein